MEQTIQIPFTRKKASTFEQRKKDIKKKKKSKVRLSSRFTKSKKAFAFPQEQEVQRFALNNNKNLNYQ